MSLNIKFVTLEGELDSSYHLQCMHWLHCIDCLLNTEKVVCRLRTTTTLPTVHTLPCECVISDEQSITQLPR
jgi:hypothetical protein